MRHRGSGRSRVRVSRNQLSVPPDALRAPGSRSWSRDASRGEAAVPSATAAGINGFGRVGRAALRASYAHEAGIEWAAINDLVDAPTLAYLLKHDTVYGRFGPHVEASDGSIVVDGHAIPTFAEAEPVALPWAGLDVDVVLECTGRFRSRAAAAQHLVEAGARKVIVSAPAKDVDATIVLGVNLDAYDPAAHDVLWWLGEHMYQ